MVERLAAAHEPEDMMRENSQEAEPGSLAQPKRYQFNLGAKLFAARHTFRQDVDGRLLLYSPDSPGLPLIVPNAMGALLDRFAEGNTMLGSMQGEAVHGPQFQELLRNINFLYERGFLRDAPDPRRYVPHGPDKSRPPPEFDAWVHVNNNCNLDCAYCFVGHTPEAMTSAVASETAQRMSLAARKYALERITIKFAGGEPTLVLPVMRHFVECLVAELRGTKTELKIALITNGTHVTDKLIEWIKQDDVSVNVSLDGYGDDHDVYRVYKTPQRRLRVFGGTSGSDFRAGDEPPQRRGSWKKIVENIAWLQAEGIVPNINATISQESCGSLAELVKWVFGSGMRLCHLGVVRQPGSSWERTPDLRGAFDRYNNLLIESFDRALTELERPEYFLDLPSALTIAELAFDNPAPDICCGMGTNHMVVRHDGNLAACPMTVGEDRFEPGDSDLIETMQRTFTESARDRGDDGECLSCEWYKVCASGCPQANKRFFGHSFTKSPLCRFWKFVIPRYVTFFGRKLVQAEQRVQRTGGYDEQGV
ncbi:radical SAM protein [Nannocystis pusilla]|uniref:radical SAM protein n=1 Tax=Nannocystis pusilla TaxID=889268 RepID=UPI003BF349AB